MQRSAIAFGKRAPSAVRHSSSSAKATSPEDLEFLRARKFSNKLIDYAARGETQGSLPNWSYGYQSQRERKDRLARPIRNAPKLAALQRTATWENLPMEPLDISEAAITTPVGTFVELRRNDSVMHGIVVGSKSDSSGLWTVSLTSEGRIMPHGEQDIMLNIPDFVEQDLALRCVPEKSELSPQELDARVQLLKKIRNLEKAVEEVSNLVHTRAQVVYDTFRSQDPQGWSRLDLSNVAQLVHPKSSVPTPVLFATHKFLMSHSKQFVAHPTSYNSSQSFLVRPKSHIETIDTVTGWMRDRSNGIMDKFVERAKRVLAENRRLARESAGEPPVLHAKGFEDIVFNENDRVILRFLYDSFQTSRSIQQSPYVIPATFIAKRLGHDPGSRKLMDSLLVTLTELGILTPWEDSPTIASRIDMLANRPKESSPVITAPLNHEPLGPEDLYKTDLLESVRHDFGDLPVYVMDDATAEELDDGVSIEPIPSDPKRFWVHVHIADPTKILPPTHRFAIEARRLAETMYYNHGSETMLPPDFHSLSLGTAAAKGEPEHVMSFSFKVDQAGDIIDYKVRAGIVRNVRTITYDQVDRMLGVETPVPSYPFLSESPALRTPDVTGMDSSHLENLRSLAKVSRQLIERRNNADVFAFTFPSSNVTFETKATPPSPKITSQPQLYRGFPNMTYHVNKGAEFSIGARGMVSEFMKAASRVASRFGIEKGIPLVRRSCHTPIIPSMEDFSKLLQARDENGLVDPFMALRARVMIPRAFNTSAPKGHWTLGIPEGEGYVRTTSPLRRYADLITHWQIKHALLNPSSGPLFGAQWISDFANELTLKEWELKRLRVQHDMYWTHLYVKRWQDGIIQTVLDPKAPLMARPTAVPASTVLGTFTKVMVPQLGVWGQLEGSEMLEIGSEVKVRITGISSGVRPVIELARV